MGATELRSAVRNLRKHFVGRLPTSPTGDVSKYVSYLVKSVRDNQDASPQSAENLRKDLWSYAYYLDAMVQKKTLLSSFGGDNVRGITPRQRIENTSERVGLKLPEQHEFQAEESNSEYAKKLDLGSTTSIRDDLNRITKDT